MKPYVVDVGRAVGEHDDVGAARGIDAQEGMVAAGLAEAGQNSPTAGQALAFPLP